MDPVTAHGLVEKRLSDTRKELLDQVEFVYQIDATDAERSRSQRHWDDMFDKLVAFQKKHGQYCLPDQTDDNHQDLYKWVRLQSGYRRTMDPYRAQRLGEIGFGIRGRTSKRSAGTLGFDSSNDTRSVLAQHLWLVLGTCNFSDGP